MNIQITGKTIELILAPAVMVTACGVLLTGMLAHYQAINDRIRALTGERLGLVFLAPGEDRTALAHERLGEIDHQVPMLVRRHRQVHHGILLAYTAVVALIVTMFLIGAASLVHSNTIASVALLVFLVAVAALMASSLFLAIEVKQSHTSIEYEAMRVVGLPQTRTGAANAPVPVDHRMEGGRVL